MSFDRGRRTGSLILLASLAVAALAAVWAPRAGGAGPAGLTRRAPAGPPSTGASGAARAAAMPGPATAPKPAPRRSGSARLPSGHPLPDSVLALVGKGRQLTVGVFRSSWSQVTPPARPDSITPEGARQFLELLTDKELLAERASEETWEWTAIESAQVANLGDRTMMRAALDSVLSQVARARAAAGQPPLGAEALGVAARESTVAALQVVYDETLVPRLAQAWGALPRPSADSSLWSRLRLMGQMPAIDPADSSRVVAWSGAGTCRVAELLDAWKKLNPLFRPRVETPDQVRDLVKNSLFERILRRNAGGQHLERHPTVLRAVERQREFLASQYFVTREVYAKTPTDDAALRRYYDRDPNAWSIPTRLQITRLLLPERGEAARMAVRLRDAAEADSLVARGLRQRVNYVAEITARGDSALFAAAMRSGTGTVLGPDSVSGGWQVARVNAVIPAHGRSFEDVKELVQRAWGDEEGERRMQELLASLRKRGRVVVNEAALAKLVREGLLAGSRTPPPPVNGRAP